MIYQMHPRNCWLAVSCVGINLAVIYSLIVPTAGNRAVAEFEFPQRLDLGSEAIAKPNLDKLKAVEPEVVKARQKYQYWQDGREIDLDISYLVGTRGSVETYLQNYTSINPQVIEAKEIKQIEEVGYHALFSDRDRAYLISCISPRSLSNVTQKQFSEQRYKNDLQLPVVLNWMQGKASIRDRRCLWVLLSTPITQGNSQSAYRTLETAWKDVYRWWLPNFPSLGNK